MDYSSDDDGGATAVMNHHEPRPRKRHVKRTDPMHTHPVIGPQLAAHVRQHADQVEADAAQNGADLRVNAAEVSMLRRWAAEIEAGLEDEDY